MRPHLRQQLIAGLTALLAAWTLFGGVASAGAASHPSLPVIERQVMCVTCKIPLNVAQSLQADRERAFIRELIQAGRDEAGIKRALVGQYGPAVLGLPSTHGFDASAYIVPLVVVLALLALLLALLPRWRSQARAQARASAASAPLPEHDAARLDADLARFD
jgi:cytochrome c-type biogenesis protein CcmH/NrfF